MESSTISLPLAKVRSLLAAMKEKMGPLPAILFAIHYRLTAWELDLQQRN